jgi:hypothetical protein
MLSELHSSEPLSKKQICHRYCWNIAQITLAVRHLARDTVYDITRVLDSCTLVLRHVIQTLGSHELSILHELAACCFIQPHLSLILRPIIMLASCGMYSWKGMMTSMLIHS